jgi:hypothetical protein
MPSVTILRAWCLCLAAIAGVGCGCSDIPIEVEAEFVEHGTVLQVGDTATIRARVLNSGDLLCVRYASQAGYGGSVQSDRFTYESSNPGVATVSNRGLVTAVQTGLANITVSAEGLVSSLIPVTVQTPPGVRGAALRQ